MLTDNFKKVVLLATSLVFGQNAVAGVAYAPENPEDVMTDEEARRFALEAEQKRAFEKRIYPLLGANDVYGTSNKKLFPDDFPDLWKQVKGDGLTLENPIYFSEVEAGGFYGDGDYYLPDRYEGVPTVIFEELEISKDDQQLLKGAGYDKIVFVPTNYGLSPDYMIAALNEEGRVMMGLQAKAGAPVEESIFVQRFYPPFESSTPEITANFWADTRVETLLRDSLAEKQAIYNDSEVVQVIAGVLSHPKLEAYIAGVKKEISQREEYRQSERDSGVDTSTMTAEEIFDLPSPAPFEVDLTEQEIEDRNSFLHSEAFLEFQQIYTDVSEVANAAYSDENYEVAAENFIKMKEMILALGEVGAVLPVSEFRESRMPTSYNSEIDWVNGITPGVLRFVARERDRAREAQEVGSVDTPTVKPSP